MKHWLITYLQPNGAGYIHFTTRVSKISPAEFCMKNYYVVTYSEEISRAAYDRGVSNSTSTDTEIVVCANYKLP